MIECWVWPETNKMSTLDVMIEPHMRRNIGRDYKSFV